MTHCGAFSNLSLYILLSWAVTFFPFYRNITSYFHVAGFAGQNISASLMLAFYPSKLPST